MSVRARTGATVAIALVASVLGCSGEKPGAEAPPPDAVASTPGTAQPAGEAAPPAAAGAEPAVPPLVGSRGPDPSAAPAPGPGALPPGHPPIGGASDPGQLVSPDPMSGRGATGVTWKTPAGWVEETPSSQLRRGQYRIPGPGGDAELAIFYFGAGQGGDPTANAQRWAGQFKQPGGGDPMEAMKTQTLDIQGMKVLLVETTGTYVNTAMSPADVGEKPNYALLGAVVPGPDANWFFKMTGPAATVKAQRASFLQLLQSVKKGA